MISVLTEKLLALRSRSGIGVEVRSAICGQSAAVASLHRTEVGPYLETLIEKAKLAEAEGDGARALAYYEEAFADHWRNGDGSAFPALLRWMSTIRRDQGDLEVAEELAEASLAVAQACGDVAASAAADNCLAIIAQLRGRLDEAESFYHRARRGAELSLDHRLIAMIDQNLGIIANIRGDVGGALARYESALAVYRDLEDRRSMLRCLNNIGMAYVDRDDWNPAETAFEEAFGMADQLRDTAMLGNIALNQAELYVRDLPPTGPPSRPGRSSQVLRNAVPGDRETPTR
jgi:tetratricopeptide (TPR) repeat protein